MSHRKLYFIILYFIYLNTLTLCLLYILWHYAEDTNWSNPYYGSILQIRKLTTGRPSIGPGPRVVWAGPGAKPGGWVPESLLSSPLSSACPVDWSFTTSPLDAGKHFSAVVYVKEPTRRTKSFILFQWSPSLELSVISGWRNWFSGCRACMGAAEVWLDPRPSVPRSWPFLLSIRVFLNPSFLVHTAARNNLPGKGF